MARRTAWYAFFSLTLAVVNTVVYVAIFLPQHHDLTVSFLNVGQGDAILIESPTGTKVLVDGGPDRSVLRELGKELAPWDRTFDLLVETHPDKDHISGLGDVLERYRVKGYLDSGIPDQTSVSRHVMDDVFREPGLTRVIARRGMRIHLGGGVYADVLFPDRDESAQTETNDGSVVLRVVYGQTSFMLTGDLPSPFEDYLVGLDGKDGELRSDVLKAGHHGSKYSTDAIWLAAVRPRYVVISAGKGNAYGHPDAETLDRVRAAGAPILSTIDRGAITFQSDGTTLSVK